jgi:hypothetical protein
VARHVNQRGVQHCEIRGSGSNYKPKTSTSSELKKSVETKYPKPYQDCLVHRLNMELDLQSLFHIWAPAYSCTHWLRPRNSPLPRIWAHIRGRYRIGLEVRLPYRYLFDQDYKRIRIYQCWIRIRMDPYYFGNLDPHSHQIKIRIRINMQVISQNVRNMSLF